MGSWRHSYNWWRLCPLTVVRTAWLAIQQDAPNIPRVDELVDYFTATWINGNFPPIHWNYFNQHQPRTNEQPKDQLHSRMKKSLATLIQTSLNGLNTCRERRQWPKQRFRATCLELLLGHRDAEWKRRKRGSRHRFNTGGMTPSAYLSVIKHLTGL